MSYKIQNIACNKKNYGGKRMKTDYIVIHYTANNGDTAVNNGNYFKNNIVKASAHFFVDKTTVVSSVPEDYIAWHVGAVKYYNNCRNNNSIGVELCSKKDSKGQFYFENEVIENAILLVKDLMKKHNNHADHVVRHYDVTHKVCPAPFVNNQIAWKNFLAKLEDKAPEAKKEINLQQWGALFTNIEHIDYIPMSGSNGSTVSEAAKTFKWNGRYPDGICNCELFNMDNFKPSSGIVNNGVEEHLPETFGFALVDNLKPVLSYKNNLKAKDWIGAYPMLLRDGKITFTSAPAGLTGKSARTALAINDTVCAIVYVKATDACTLEEFAQAILARGFHTAINLDGGGSTACITPGVAYDQGRKVRGKLGIWIKNGTGNKLAQNKIAEVNQIKVSTTAGLNLRSQATTTSAIKEVLLYNSVHTWTGAIKKVGNDNWYEIKSAKGNTGWVMAKYVTLL